jgi:DNA-binding MarR family transcriptional regulator
MNWFGPGEAQLIGPLLRGFYWWDDGLQSYLRAGRWRSITRPQSMVMISVAGGTKRPADIARQLGVSRQAAHLTIQQLVDKGMLFLADDPSDGRAKMVVYSEKGHAMNADAQKAMVALRAELVRRIGQTNLNNLLTAFEADWGEPPSFEEPDCARS